MRGKTPDHILTRSRQLRRDMTEAEEHLWHRVRDRRLGGYKFRTQAPIGPYYADFLCSKERLVVELDGSQHVDDKDHDDNRTAFLARQGYRVIRFWNNDVLARTDEVLDAILAALRAPHPAASPLSLSPSGRGKGDMS
nr:endonuclease domain-containing protein [Sphingomonas sp. SUN039]